MVLASSRTSQVGKSTEDADLTVNGKLDDSLGSSHLRMYCITCQPLMSTWEADKRMPFWDGK
jgi:hypothetical protein